MSGAQLVLAHANKIVMVALLAGMVWRGRLGQCWAFSAYVGAALVGNALSSFWPDRFFTPSFWMFKQAVYDALKMAIGLELAYRAFAAFPGAWRTARLVLLAVFAVSTFALAFLTPRASYETVWDWQPSILTAAVWLLTATALIVTWYRLPIGAWPRVIMLGLAPYLLTFATMLRLIQRRGGSIEWVGVLDSVAWLVLTGFWVYTAWGRDRGASGPTGPVTAHV
jgi:hypothetical protein